MKKNRFEHFGVMIDMSLNSVMSVDGLKSYLPLLKKMGYNTVMLYTEDTYEVDGEPYFGYMRGRYTKEELKELDAYVTSLGMELIPCIQTLAHLNALVRWGKHPVDCNDILLVDDPKTYEFIERLFATLSQCFTSKLIHIGMDEAFMLGRGRHLDLYGYETKTAIIKRHLDRVSEIATKYGYKCLMWSDMFFSWADGYYQPRIKMPEEIIQSVNKNIVPIYWDYYHGKEEEYDGMIYNHRQLSPDFWFAGGVWSWMGVTPLNRFSIDAMVPAIRACRKNKVKNVFMTMWGDFGGECSHFAQLSALFYIAEYARGNEDEDLIKARFRKTVGIDFDEFMMVDSANRLKGVTRTENPSRYMLYSDYFNGFLDYTVNVENVDIYHDYAEKLEDLAKKYRKFGYIFDTQAKLCGLLEYKYALGYKTRQAYRTGDKDELLRLAENDYNEVKKRLKLFYNAFKKQWYKENKTSGFDVQDLRLGGLMLRTESCRTRILDYVSGRIDRIEELETTVLPIGNGAEGEAIEFNYIPSIMSTNVY